jgi:hypothetical protein
VPVLQGLTASQDSDDLDKASNTVQKFKEKNRAAQRRYRERQKVVLHNCSGFGSCRAFMGPITADSI